MRKIITRQALFAALAAAVAWAPSLQAQEATEEVWRPTPPVTKIPYPLRPVVPKEKQRHERLRTMSFDGTFESYAHGTPVARVLDDDKRTVMFGADACFVANTGYKSRMCLSIPSGNGNTCGIEEKNIPLKPDTWYRVSLMAKGTAYKMLFSYPAKPPESGDDYANLVYLDHNHGGGYSFYYVCSKCEFVKPGVPDKDGHWVVGGFRVIPDKCPECGAEDALYRDGDRRYYAEWTYIFVDFKTSGYVGKMANGVYNWYAVFTGTAANTFIDDFLVYEITGEGGDPVGGDEYATPRDGTEDETSKP